MPPSLHHLSLSDEERASLGDFVSFHPGGSRMLIINIAIAFGVGLILLALTFLPFNRKPPRTNVGVQIEVVAVFGCLTLLAGAGLMALIRKLFWKVYLFERGFAWAGRPHRIILWDQVKSMYQRQDFVVGIKADGWIRLVLVNGMTIRLDSSLKDFARLRMVMSERVDQAVFRKAVSRLDQGERVEFGTLTLHPDGLENTKKDWFGRTTQSRLAWEDVHHIGIEPRDYGNAIVNCVVILRKDPVNPDGVEWFTQSVLKFPNPSVLFELARSFGCDGPQMQ